MNHDDFEQRWRQIADTDKVLSDALRPVRHPDRQVSDPCVRDPRIPTGDEIQDLRRRAHDGDSVAIDLLCFGLACVIERTWGVRQREHRKLKRGQIASAETRRATAPPEWMTDLFDRAYAEIQADGKVRVGHAALLGVAWRVAGIGHPDREKLTEHRARQYLKNRPKSRR